MEKFWETTALADMDEAQWESLCDGAAGAVSTCSKTTTAIYIRPMSPVI